MDMFCIVRTALNFNAKLSFSRLYRSAGCSSVKLVPLSTEIESRIKSRKLLKRIFKKTSVQILTFRKKNENIVQLIYGPYGYNPAFSLVQQLQEVLQSLGIIKLEEKEKKWWTSPKSWLTHFLSSLWPITKDCRYACSIHLLWRQFNWSNHGLNALLKGTMRNATDHD